MDGHWKDRERRKRRPGLAPWLFFFLALILPGIALSRATSYITPKYVIAYLAGISALTAYAYWSDKKKARADAWRTPEHALHSLELLGGWAAAFLSQRLFRHKTVKKEYQFTFWLIAVAHQCVAFDFLNHWRCAAGIHRFVEAILR